MADCSFRVHYNFNGKTQNVDFSIPTEKVTDETKLETAKNLINQKHPEFDSENIVISKVDIG